MKMVTLSVFIIICLAQWFIPLSMILEHETLRAEGKAFKFKTQPIDPTDPFRGSYVILNFAIQSYETDTTGWKENEEIYVLLKEDDNGFAAIAGISHTQPTTATHYVKAMVRSIYGNKLQIHFPFDRFYVEESKAENVQKAYNHSGAEQLPHNIAYALVYIKDGESSLTDVLVNGKSIIEIVREKGKGA